MGRVARMKRHQQLCQPPWKTEHRMDGAERACADRSGAPCLNEHGPQRWPGARPLCRSFKPLRGHATGSGASLHGQRLPGPPAPIGRRRRGLRAVRAMRSIPEARLWPACMPGAMKERRAWATSIAFRVTAQARDHPARMAPSRLESKLAKPHETARNCLSMALFHLRNLHRWIFGASPLIRG